MTQTETELSDVELRSVFQENHRAISRHFREAVLVASEWRRGRTHRAADNNIRDFDRREVKCSITIDDSIFQVDPDSSRLAFDKLLRPQIQKVLVYDVIGRDSERPYTVFTNTTVPLCNKVGTGTCPKIWRATHSHECAPRFKITYALRQSYPADMIIIQSVCP